MNVGRLGEEKTRKKHNLNASSQQRRIIKRERARPVAAVCIKCSI